MVPKLHKKGYSFKGAGLYILRDKGRAQTSHRVEWVETRNLSVDDPDLGWRIMAATAMDADRLKAQAGVKNTGRKSKQSVLHLTLSWHPDEAEGLNRDEMMRAANGAIRVLGASDRQAMIVAHNDEEQPHVHILINRISVHDGRMLSSSKEKLKLSEFAETYEKERGRIFCEERVINNDARRRGEFTRGDKDQARHIFELEHQAANDNVLARHFLHRQQREEDAKIAKLQRENEERHKTEWEKLVRDHKERMSKLRQTARWSVGKAQSDIDKKYRPQWTYLRREQEAAMRHFEKQEKTLLGRMKNAYAMLDLKGMVSGDDRRGTIARNFSAISSSGERKEALERQHEQQRRDLQKRQDQEKQQVVDQSQGQLKTDLAQNRQRFETERAQLVLAQQMDHTEIRALWRARREQRHNAWERHCLVGNLVEDHPHTNQNQPGLPESPEIEKTRAGDLLPREGAAEKADLINHYKELMRQKRLERKNRRGKGRGR